MNTSIKLDSYIHVCDIFLKKNMACAAYVSFTYLSHGAAE